MIISYQWLLQYLPEPLPVDELSGILTAIGLEVEHIETVEAVKGSLKGLVIGQVLSAERHPNADKLSLTTVHTGGDEPLSIVCGAPNVAAGQKVVVAPVGTMVHPLSGEPFLIKKAKIRGAESAGMICAEDEIGLGDSHAGIMVLPEDARVGQAASDYFNIPEPDYAIHIGLTPNRSDAMSHIGVARDLCAYLSHHRGKTYRPVLPVVILPAPSQERLNIPVSIEAPEACSRYMGVSIQGLKVGPSPAWLQQRLQAIGVRPINNVVDITNFVLHEWGQPLHAFDADRIRGAQVRVGFEPAGTIFRTLDGEERKLQAHDLMICDAIGGMCIAGVFGGQNSGVTEATTRVFLESACFDATHIRRSSLQHGLRTDAATHFEKGVDMENLAPALKRAASLMVELAGGIIASDITDVYPRPATPVEVAVTYAYINRLCGKVYEPQTVKGILEALGFTVKSETPEGLIVQVPSNKTDVLQAADIVEEILRIDGLDQVPIPARLNISLTRPMPSDRPLREKLSAQLCGQGFQEIITNSIVNSRYYPERTDLVRMLNSLSSELDVLRPSMLESGLEVIAYNNNRKNNDLALFEFGKVYAASQEGYMETDQLALWITGNMQPAHWNGPAIASGSYYLKGVVQNLMRRGGIERLSVTVDPEHAVTSWKWKNEVLATARSVDAARLKEFDVRQEVFYAEINWPLWCRAAEAARIRYTEVPRFPAVQRDLAIVIDRGISYEQVRQATEKLKLEALQSFDLFDVFESDKLGAGKKSYALSYTFQLQDRTLTETEIEKLMEVLITAYRNQLQAQIRS